MTTTYITGALLITPIIIGLIGIAIFSAKRKNNNNDK